MNTIDLRDIASDFRLTAVSLTQLLTRLERVVGASQEPVNRESLDTLYDVRDSALENFKKVTEIISRLEKK